MSCILREVSLSEVAAAAQSVGGQRDYDLPRAHTAMRLVRWQWAEGQWTYAEHHLLGVWGMLEGDPPLPGLSIDDLLVEAHSEDFTTRCIAFRGLAFLLKRQWRLELEPLLLPDLLSPIPARHLPVGNLCGIAEWDTLRPTLEAHQAEAPWLEHLLERYF